MRFFTATQTLVLGLFASAPVFAGAIPFDDGVEASGGHMADVAVAASHWVKIPRNIEGILERRERKGKQNINLPSLANRNQQRAAEPKAEPQRNGKGNENRPPPNRNQQRGAEAKPQQKGKGIGIRSPLLDRAQQREIGVEPQRKGKTNVNRPPPLGNRNQQRQAPDQGKQSPSPPTSMSSHVSTPPAKLDQRQGKGRGAARPPPGRPNRSQQREADGEVKENKFTPLPKLAPTPAQTPAPPPPAKRIQ